jgi:hypothetical protein
MYISIFVRLAAVTALALTVGSLPASAEQLRNRGSNAVDDPLMLMAEQDLAKNQFILDNSRDVELVRFKKPHDLQVCSAPADPGAIGGTKHGYPIEAVWDGDTAVIYPGNCLSFDAQRLKNKPASQIPDSVVLTGTVRVLR